jgi:CheY-like chemotaxis protein
MDDRPIRILAVDDDERALRALSAILRSHGKVATMIVFTCALDRTASGGHLPLPEWVASGSADTAGQVLTALPPR